MNMIDKIFEDVKEELERACKKFPDNTNNFVALSEEFGELAKALLHITEKQDGTLGTQHKLLQDTYDEGVQLITMTVKLLTRGDPSLNYKGRYCSYANCSQPHRGGPCELCHE